MRIFLLDGLESVRCTVQSNGNFSRLLRRRHRSYYHIGSFCPFKQLPNVLVKKNKRNSGQNLILPKFQMGFKIFIENRTYLFKWVFFKSCNLIMIGKLENWKIGKLGTHKNNLPMLVREPAYFHFVVLYIRQALALSGTDL